MPSGIYKRTKPVSEETRKKISLSLIGNRRSLGYKFTEEQRKNMRNARQKFKKLGTESANWRGGESEKRNSNGYVYSYIGGGKYQPKQNLVVEEYIGYKLKKGQIIHHINFNRKDNRIENLYLFRSKSTHIKYHRFLKRNNLNGENNQLTSNLWIYKVD